jgi:hypothetical protein
MTVRCAQLVEGNARKQQSGVQKTDRGYFHARPWWSLPPRRTLARPRAVRSSTVAVIVRLAAGAFDVFLAKHRQIWLEGPPGTDAAETLQMYPGLFPIPCNNTRPSFRAAKGGTVCCPSSPLEQRHRAVVAAMLTFVCWPRSI